ncbi:MAG TPA: hypothetical protein PLS81_04975 [Deltaproteobacteria bacterium]|nr:hypothetical protein [Deltaproteobacteria bacterium]HOM28791.1 hypothetical protein [Deltaproteobacteria bacterium]HPP80058.1 hypothetical protein [Deltaproteobacteria bacterium]
MEEMQQAGFTKEQIEQVISIKVNVREANKKWTEEELRQLDANLRASWRSMVQALARGDVETASAFFERDMRDIHRMLLAATPHQQRKLLLEALEDIRLLGVKGSNLAEYRVNIPQARTIYTYRGELVFIRNDEGVWEIKSF